MKALCLGWVHNSALACREGWVGTTLRLFFNLAENKGTGLRTLREYANKFTCTSWVTLGYPAKASGAAWLGAWSMGLLVPFLLPTGLPGIRDPRGEGGCQ